VAGRAPNRLDQRAARPQETFSVRIQDGHQRNFRQIEADAVQARRMAPLKRNVRRFAADKPLLSALGSRSRPSVSPMGPTSKATLVSRET